MWTLRPRAVLYLHIGYFKSAACEPFILSLCMEGVTLASFSSKQIREDMIETLKAVAHPVRLKIVNILLNGECSVGDISRALGTKQATTSQHLSIMKSRGVLKSRRDRNVVYYSFKHSGIKKIMAVIIAEL